MMSHDSIFPLRPELEATDREPRTIELFTEEGHQTIDVLSSDTARQILKKLRDDPATKSGIADRVETSIQNAYYHLERLDDAGLVQIIGTHYSSRGMEMDVYAPKGTPLLIVGDDAYNTTPAGGAFGDEPADEIFVESANGTVSITTRHSSPDSQHGY